MTQPILLTEYQTATIPAERLSESEAKQLWEQFRPVFQLDPPSFKNNNRWVIVPQGWVGHIELSAGTQLVIQPKVPIGNLFAMLKQLYGLPSFNWLDGLTQTQTIAGFWDLLARELALRVLARIRQGIAKDYVDKHESLNVIRGRVDARSLAVHPNLPTIMCDYAEQTADLPKNQILAYTLKQVARSSVCSAETRKLVNRAWRQLPVTLQPFTSDQVASWDYSRLEQDYRPMHALCGLFLDGLEPTHHPDEDGSPMLPFLVSMPHLYEKMVAQWLKTHLPEGYALREQERVKLDTSAERHVDIDLVIYDRNNRPIWVLDTKYKAGEPTNDDIYQVTFYAREIGCDSAGLIYPVQPARPLSGKNQRVHYRSFTFGLERDVDVEGNAFLEALSLQGLT